MMRNIKKIANLKVNDWVYHVPDHLEPLIINADKGIITAIKNDKIWVRFRGPTGELCRLENLYK